MNTARITRVRRGFSRNTIKKNLYTAGTACSASLNVSLSMEYRVYLDVLDEAAEAAEAGLSVRFMKKRRMSKKDEDGSDDDELRVIAVATTLWTSCAILTLMGA